MNATVVFDRSGVAPRHRVVLEGAAPRRRFYALCASGLSPWLLSMPRPARQSRHKNGTEANEENEGLEPAYLGFYLTSAVNNRACLPAVMGASDYRHRGVGETERGCVRSTSRSGISPPLRIRARCGWSFGHSRGPVVVEDAPGRHSPCGEGWIRLVFVVNRSSARVAQLDRVTASEAAGCGFDSRRAHQSPHDGSAKCEVRSAKCEVRGRRRFGRVFCHPVSPTANVQTPAWPLSVACSHYP